MHLSRKNIAKHTVYLFNRTIWRLKIKRYANAVIKMSYNESDIDDKSQQLIYTDETYEQIKKLINL